MCFSIAVDKNINKLSDFFGAMIDSEESQNLSNLFLKEAQTDSKEFSRLLGLPPTRRGSVFKLPAEDGRIFSNYFTNILVDQKEVRLIQPMRYRVRPAGSKEEVPAKFNVFNARLDSLESRQTWRPLFMKRHGIVPMTSFFEWVPGPLGKPKLISFFPKGRDFMWAPCLWDEWISKDGQIRFKSFAIITDEPPVEIERMGHDRCPIFLSADRLDEWLNPKDSTRNEIYDLLKKREEVTFDYLWA